jgi:hypothetical protein
MKGGKLVAPEFTYCSDNNKDWMSIDALKEWMAQNSEKIGKV